MASIVSVKKRKGEPFQKLLSRFKRKVRASEHLIELKNRQEFLKPSVIKRKAMMNAKREQELATKLQKIEDGDTKIKLYSKKRKKSNNASNKK